MPQLSFDPQYYRGEACGSFKFSSQRQGRFVFVSNYSSGVDPEGLSKPAARFRALADVIVPP